MLNTDGVIDEIDLEGDLCEQFDHPRTDCHTDIPKLTEGMVGAQVKDVEKVVSINVNIMSARL